MRHVYQIQAQVTTSPSPYLDPNLVAVKLIGACAGGGNPRHGARFFWQYLGSPNMFAFNALLKALALHNLWVPLLSLFNRHRPKPDEYTFTSLIKACAALSTPADGRKIHCLVIKYGCELNLFVTNSLVDYYFKLGSFHSARKLFDAMPTRDVVSWNTLVSGYCLSGLLAEARAVFDSMGERCVVSWSTMVSAYARAGDLKEARRIFEEMPERNAVCWNAMISGYARGERYRDAVEVFQRMWQEGRVEPNDVTLVSVLSAAAHLEMLDLGVWIDGYIRRKKMELGLFLGNALADMYAKCGCVREAKRVFDEMEERDVISWSIIISGLAMNGHADEAFGCFEAMLENGVEPNEVTFMGLLRACTHVGLVEKGLEYFDAMELIHRITPTIEHYGCVVDLLSRAGRLDEAEKLINSMPVKPNVIVWGALLGGCRIYKDPERGERAVHRILELEPDHSGSYVYLVDIYRSMGRLDDAARCKLRMLDNGAVKTPGCSWIKVDDTVALS